MTLNRFEGSWQYLKAMVYVTGVMNVVSSGLFLYAGVLLMGYQKKGVWFGFGAVGVAVSCLALTY